MQEHAQPVGRFGSARARRFHKGGFRDHVNEVVDPLSFAKGFGSEQGHIVRFHAHGRGMHDEIRA